MRFVTSKGEVQLKGSLVSLSADNLGSHFIGGFKGSCTASRPCRHCMVQYDDMKNHVSISAGIISIGITITQNRQQASALHIET